MLEQIAEKEFKMDEYLDVIQSRIIEPIEKANISQYCTATLLLLFAALNGLGKLIHDNPKAGSNDRIRAFLDYMGGNYGKRKKELLNLRHSLMHEAMNVASYMSKADIGSSQHLNLIGSAGFIYVNTKVMYKDFVLAFERLQKELKSNEQMMHRAAERLEWKEEDHYFDFPATPPPPVEFIWAK
jgi:hypothetical protein